MTAATEDAFAEGSIGRQMARIALPLGLSAGVRYAVELANAYWVGKLGVVALSIVAALGTFLSLSKMFAGLTSAGTSAVVGRMVGEGRLREANRVAQKVTAVTLVLGAGVALLTALLSGFALDALRFHGPDRTEAMRYLLVLLLGLPVSFGMMSMNGVLVGLGRPRASLRASTASLFVGFIVTPVLVRLLGVGVWGAAVAQVAGDSCGYLIGLRALRGHVGEEEHLPWKKRFQKLRELWPVFRIGAPLTADAVIHAGVWFGLVAFLASYGNQYVAAQGAEERLTQILNVPSEGIAPAAATLVGYMLGQNRRRDALRVVWTALGAVAVIAFGGAALLRLTPTPVVVWLCNDASFVEVGVQVLMIASMGLAFVGGRDVMEASFGGVGNTIPPVVIGLGIALARFPLAWLIAVRLDKGGLGVAWAVNTTLVVQTVLLLVWFLVRFRQTSTSAIEPIAASIPPPPIDSAA
jgi:putative MATE family efflux protein